MKNVEMESRKSLSFHTDGCNTLGGVANLACYYTTRFRVCGGRYVPGKCRQILPVHIVGKLTDRKTLCSKLRTVHKIGNN